MEKSHLRYHYFLSNYIRLGYKLSEIASYQVQGSHQKSDKNFPDFFPDLKKNISTFSEKFYLEHEMIIPTFFKWNHKNIFEEQK